MSKHYFERFGAYLKEARAAAGLSQSEVAGSFQYDQQLISNWERGVSAPPVRLLRKLAKLYNVPVDDLYQMLLDDAVLRTRLRLESEFRKTK